MPEADARHDFFTQDVDELIEESDRQLRQSRDLIAHLDKALARGENLLRQPVSQRRPDLGPELEGRRFEGARDGLAAG